MGQRDDMNITGNSKREAMLFWSNIRVRSEEVCVAHESSYLEYNLVGLKSVDGIKFCSVYVTVCTGNLGDEYFWSLLMEGCNWFNQSPQIYFSTMFTFDDYWLLTPCSLLDHNAAVTLEVQLARFLWFSNWFSILFHWSPSQAFCAYES